MRRLPVAIPSGFVWSAAEAWALATAGALHACAWRAPGCVVGAHGAVQVEGRGAAWFNSSKNWLLLPEGRTVDGRAGGEECRRRARAGCRRPRLLSMGVVAEAFARTVAFETELMVPAPEAASSHELSLSVTTLLGNV